MTDPPENPFAPEELRLIRAEQDNVSAPDAALDRVRARLVPAFPSIASIGRDAKPVATAPGPAPSGMLAGSIPKWILAMTTAGLFGAGAHAALTSPRERIVYVDRVVVSPIAASQTSPPSALAAVPVEHEAPTMPRRPAPSAERKADRASRLAEERALLDSARNAIVRGQPGDALEPLDAHLAAFPDGVLAEEREALAIKALARVGRSDEAEARAAAFRRRFPQSLLEDGVEHDLRKNP